MNYPELFSKCIVVILKNEGGYVNNPKDPGGETQYGIAKRFHPNIDIKNLTIGGAMAIYYTEYWLPMNLEGINNDELVLHVFDHGVNAGVVTAIKILQRLVGVGDDGVIGDETRRAIREYNGDITTDFIKRRKLFYVTLVQKKPSMRGSLRGWLNRIEHTKFKTNGNND
jgi:lysozyme family protein